ncbi:extracellular solute-binding protein [Deinococcus deserti]|uniref:Putative sugar ABC transporter, periplasmic component n=1 Tax=Deinococcus deserti (strain DSM 17065 / CIP 109153 / LMG 22923 / VCD115) TaxID=546414 RepID=C1D230_DEIDV|nr:extracellular solute-binding protein [Deinococcus deserti]ACO47469.1 putative sugar ABC transporter, periplasmic component [Deinococcus deserti VCD115]
MKKLLTLALALSVTASAAPVTLTYWQYDFASKVSTMNELIKKFEAQNPDIKIKQETFPYDAYNQKVASSVPAGQGPDVVNLFYGWLPQYVDSGYLQPLPEKEFPIRAIESGFVPMIKTSKMNGKYYALPTSVRTLAVFYNKDLLKASGVLTPPRTWEDFIAASKKIVKGSPPRFTQLGFGIQPDGQDFHMVREVLIRQFGGTPYSDGGKKVNYDSPAGVKAMTFYTELFTKHKLGTPNFFPGNNSYRDAFIAGKVGMIIDGSFAVATISKGAKFNWGVMPLPTFKNSNVRGNFGSYWVNGITKNAKGEKLEAAVKFIKFLTSAETQQTWLRSVGEIPASKKLVNDPALRKDPVYGPFVYALPFASSTLFVDEAGQRKAWVDAINTVLLQGGTPANAVKRAAAEEQKILDGHYK